MLSFRYHLITIVSIFLAIALGIVMGAAFVQDPLLGQLRAQTDQLSRDVDRLESALGRAERRAEALEAFSEEAYERLAAGRLQDVPVVVLTQEGTATADLDDARAAVSAAGGVIEADLTVTRRILGEDEDDREALAAALGESPSAPAVQLTAAAAEAIGVRLADGPGSDPDVLVPLIADGFVIARRVQPEDLASVGGPGTLVVALAGGDGEPSLEMEQFMLPCLSGYVSRGRWAIAAQASDSEYPYVALLRADEELRASVSSVDDLELPAGRLALVLASADLVRDRTVGHYGLAPELPLLPPAREP